MTFGEGIGNSDNRYKYNGKELDRMHGLDLYDYGARMQNGMQFTTIDPLAEKYYSVSPYAYCENNPLNKIDPDGNSSEDNWDTGKYEDESGNEVSWEDVENEYGIGRAKDESKGKDVSDNLSENGESCAPKTHNRKFKIGGYPNDPPLINVYPEFDLFLLLINPIKGLFYKSSVKVIEAAETSTTTVGRWMSRAEYDIMANTGRMVEGAGG